VTFITIFEPVTTTVHASAAVVLHVGVPSIVTFAGTGSVTVADPGPVPTFFTTIV
jgi:hypothetical protein